MIDKEFKTKIRKDLATLDKDSLYAQFEVVTLATRIISVCAIISILSALIFSSLLIYAVAVYAVYNLAKIGINLDAMRDEINLLIVERYSSDK